MNIAPILHHAPIALAVVVHAPYILSLIATHIATTVIGASASRPIFTTLTTPHIALSDSTIASSIGTTATTLVTVSALLELASDKVAVVEALPDPLHWGPLSLAAVVAAVPYMPTTPVCFLTSPSGSLFDTVIISGITYFIVGTVLGVRPRNVAVAPDCRAATSGCRLVAVHHPGGLRRRY